MIISILLLFLWTNLVDGNHFNGGIITWAPVYPDSNSSSILITVTQSYSWVSPNENCTTNIPRSFGGNANLTCIANCSTQGGYATQTISIRTDCSSFIASLGLVFSERSVNITLNSSTYFWLAYKGAAWRSLDNALTNNTPGWSVASLIDLRRRPDGLINTPPVSHVASPQYVLVNTTTAINLLVSDVNSGDDLRCRWSRPNSSSGVDECSAVCPSTSLLNISSLSNCTLSFSPTRSGAWYAISVQVEDFFDTTSTTAMSSVPIQFLIYVLPTPSCSIPPLIIPLTDCFEVEVNIPVNYTLFAMNYCNRSRTIITDLIPAVNINGMIVSNIANSTANASLVSITLIWTPRSNQIGPQKFCAIAYNNERVQSSLYCVTFSVVTSNPCLTTSTSTSTSTTETVTVEISTATISNTIMATNLTINASDTTLTTTPIQTSMQTTVTVTTSTTANTSSITFTTDIQTAKNEKSKEPNIFLIVGLSLLGLIFSLCCCFCWLCFLNRAISKRRQSTKETERKSQDGIEDIAVKQDRKNRDTGKSKTYARVSGFRTSNINKVHQSMDSTNSESILCFDTVKTNYTTRSSLKKNSSTKLHKQESREENNDEKSTGAEKDLRLQHPSVTVSYVKKSISLTDMREDDEYRSVTMLFPKERKSLAADPNVHVTKVPKNKLAVSPDVGSSIISKPTDITTVRQNNLDISDNTLMNSVCDRSKQRLSADGSTTIIAKSKGADSRLIRDKTPKTHDPYCSGRQRASSLVNAGTNNKKSYQ